MVNFDFDVMYSQKDKLLYSMVCVEILKEYQRKSFPYGMFITHPLKQLTITTHNLDDCGCLMGFYDDMQNLIKVKAPANINTADVILYSGRFGHELGHCALMLRTFDRKLANNLIHYSVNNDFIYTYSIEFSIPQLYQWFKVKSLKFTVFDLKALLNNQDAILKAIADHSANETRSHPYWY